MARHLLAVMWSNLGLALIETAPHQAHAHLFSRNVAEANRRYDTGAFKQTKSIFTSFVTRPYVKR